MCHLLAEASRSQPWVPLHPSFLFCTLPSKAWPPRQDEQECCPTCIRGYRDLCWIEATTNLGLLSDYSKEYRLGVAVSPLYCIIGFWGLARWRLVVRNLPTNAGDRRASSLIPDSGRSPGEGHGNPLQYSCLEDLMGREDWWATVHMVAELTGLKRLSTHARSKSLEGEHNRNTF